jgi:hypothetical protein
MSVAPRGVLSIVTRIVPSAGRCGGAGGWARPGRTGAVGAVGGVTVGSGGATVGSGGVTVGSGGVTVGSICVTVSSGGVTGGGPEFGAASSPPRLTRTNVSTTTPRTATPRMADRRPRPGRGRVPAALESVVSGRDAIGVADVVGTADVPGVADVVGTAVSSSPPETSAGAVASRRGRRGNEPKRRVGPTASLPDMSCSVLAGVLAGISGSGSVLAGVLAGISGSEYSDDTARCGPVAWLIVDLAASMSRMSSAAVCTRSAGDFASIRRTSASISCGTPFVSDAIVGGASRMWAASTSPCPS